MKILKCVKCNIYTLKAFCPKCSLKTISNLPAKYSPEDKHGFYRRLYKEQNLK